MFRALKKYMDQDGFTNATDAQNFNESQRVLYQQQLPNMVPVATQSMKNSLKDVMPALATVNPITRTTSTEGVDIYTYATPIELPENIRAKVRDCETASIDQVIQNQNMLETERCGWIYEKGPSGTAPKVSRGVYGTAAGPFNFTNVQTTAANYYWDPVQAQKAMMRDRCAELVDCTNVENSDYTGKCAYDPIRGVGIPIHPDGSIMFPNDPNLSANPKNLITKRGSCPVRPPPNSPAATYQSRDVCTPLSNGTLSRDCMLQQYRTAGCSDTGALGLALRSGGSLTDYTANLRGTLAYTTYQARAAAPLVEAVIRDGSQSKEVALANFRSLSAESAKPSSTALQAAARDLCINAGTLDSFDFCSELTETSPITDDMTCLQREWIKRGGTTGGFKYPSDQTRDFWKKLKLWGLALKEMDRMAAEVRIKDGFADFTAPQEKSNEQRQSDALGDFMGLPRQVPPPAQIPAYGGAEIFWFDLTSNAFMGRVVNSSMPVINTGGIIPIVNKQNSVQLIMMTNVRAATDGRWRIGATTDDGVSVRINKNYQPTNEISWYKSDLVKNTADEMSRYYLQGTTSHVNDACWDFKKGGPNIIVADWYENFGWARFEMFVTPCDDKNKKTALPTNELTLTQEPDAPFLSFEYTADGLRERRLPALFESPHTGGALVDLQKKAVQLMRNGSITLRKPLMTNSWRSITIHWTPYGNLATNQRHIFCSYGSLFETYFQNGKTYVKFTGPSLTRTIEWDTKYTTGLDFIFYINMRSSFEGGVPDIMTFGVQQREWYAAGNWNGGIELLMPQNRPLYNASDSGSLVLGTTSTPPEVVSANVGIKAVRFFDKELTAADLARDASNLWQRQWIGEGI